MIQSKFVGGTGIAAIALALSACGGGASGNAQGSPANEAATASPAPSGAVPEAVRKDCANLPQADAKTDNDILGIDLGMRADDAIKIAKCNKEGFTVSVVDDTSVPVPDGSHPRGKIVMDKDGDEIDAFLVGVPGQEKVYALMRGKTFADGTEPTMDQMRATITQKYSPLAQQVVSGTSYPNTLVLALSPDGQRLADDKAKDCTFTFGQTLTTTRNALGQLTEQCGFTKKIELRPKESNGAVVGGFVMWISDQNAFFAQARQEVAGIRAMQVNASEAERQKAASSNRAPTL